MAKKFTRLTLMVTFTAFLKMGSLYAQAPCIAPIPSTYDFICPNSSEITVGASTDIGPTYSWYQNGQLKRGPRAGTGGSISYNFSVSSPADAGHYYIVEKRPGFPDGCVFSRSVVYLGGVSNLIATNITSNTVSFSWTPTAGYGSYEYAVTESEFPPAGGIETGYTSITVNALNGGTNYYIHARNKCSAGSVEWTSIPFSTLPGQCSAVVSGVLLDTYNEALKAGSYCIGQTVFIKYPGITGQQYTLLKNGTPVSAVKNGADADIDFSFSFSNVSLAGLYSIQITKTGCLTAETANVPISSKTAVTNLSLQSVNEISASFTWSNADPNMSFDYAVTATSVPPVVPGNSTFSTSTTVSNLLPGTNYYFHVRPSCSAGTGPAWVSIPFAITAITPVNCIPVPVSVCATVTIANISEGGGAWDFSGTYPVNSTGLTTPGKEKLYSFTPTETAVYYLDITAVQYRAELSYFYKPFSAGCTNTGWTGIKSVKYTGKYAFGKLTAGTTYLLLMDNNNVTAAQHNFRICKASVAAPSQNNRCISTFSNLTINPAKEEFFLDANGNLVASLDASGLSSFGSIDSISFYVNSNAVRRDDGNREYLDRDFSLYSPTPGLKVKLYMTNAELNRLINEPNDGIADVNSVTDLQASRVFVNCGIPITGSGSLTLYGQQNSGTYEGANAFYIEFSIQEEGTYFLHGGNAALNYVCGSEYIPFEQGFNMPNNSLLPPCWSKQNNGADISFASSSVSPATSPYEGSRFVFFNSHDYPAATNAIVNTPVIYTQGYSSVDVEFYWYNNNNPLYTLATEGVQLEYSLNNINWNIVSFVARHDASLVSGTGQWKKKRILLPAEVGNMDMVYLRFNFISQHGDNCAMDALTITPSVSCADVGNLAVTNLTSNAVNFNWSPVAGVSSYQYKVSTDFPIYLDGTNTAATSAAATGLSPLTNYYLYAKPLCSVGNYGAWNSILIKTRGTCSGENINFFYNTQYSGPSYVYHWQVNTGSGFTDISNGAVYSGATTTSLLITNPPGSYSGYKYRCAVAFNFDPANYYYYGNVNTIQFVSTWKGTISNAWNNAVNWSCNVVPDANTDIVIPAGAVFQPQVNSNISCKSLKVEDGATVSVLTGNTITVTGK